MARRPNSKPDTMPPMVWMPGDGPGPMPAMVQRPDDPDTESEMPPMVWMPGGGPGPMPPMFRKPYSISTAENNCPLCHSSYDGAVTWHLERVRWYVFLEPDSLVPSKGTQLTCISIKYEMRDMVPDICEPTN